MVHNVLQTAVEAFLLLFYTLILFVIITSKTAIFRNAFFSIFVATGIADIASLLSCCFVRLNRELGLDEGFQSVALACLTVSGAAFVAHMIGNMLITINRYSAVCLTNKYDVIWTRKFVLAAVVVQYFVSFAAFIHLTGAKMICTHHEDGTVACDGLENHVDLIVRSTFVVACVIYATVCLSLNTKLLVELNRLSKSHNWEHTHHEKRLLIYTSLVFICSILMCSQQVTKSISAFTNNDALNTWVTMQYFWINDVMVSLPPISLLLLSSDLRLEIFNFFRRRRHNSVANLHVSASVPSSKRSEF